MSHPSGFPVIVLLTGLVLHSAEVASSEMDFEARCHREVVALHDTIEGWLAGTLPNSDAAYGRFSAAMADDFEITSPSGDSRDRAGIIASLRAAHGAQGTDFSITIKNVRTRLLAPPLALLTYEEWQSGGGQTTARLSTVLMRDDPDAPGGVAWVHLHETWLPGLAPLSR